MQFAIAGEGLTDFIVIKNLLIGFFNDKNLPVRRLLPEDTEPVGWGNLFNYLATDKFRDGVENNDFTIVQIGSGTCQDWKETLQHIGDDITLVDSIIAQIIQVLINKIGEPFYTNNKEKILFAICVHDIECWLLPFNTDTPAHQSKIVNCTNALEKKANQLGFSIHKKNYQESKNFETLTKELKKNKTLLQLSPLNPSLKSFIEMLMSKFPPSPLDMPPPEQIE